MKRQAVETQAQEVVGEAPWPFSCEVAVGQFSKLDEQVREGEEQEFLEELDLQVVRQDRPQVARDPRTVPDRASCRTSDIKTRPNKLWRGVPGGVELSIRSVLGAQGK